MKVFELDNVLYKGDLVINLISFGIEKKEKYKEYVPLIKPLLMLYKMDILPINKIESFIDKYDDKFDLTKDKAKKLAELFWEENKDKLNKELLSKITRNDLIITTAPKEFFEPLKLKTKKILGSVYNYKTKDIEFICYKENRYKKYKELYDKYEVTEYYTNNDKDKELIKRAKKVIKI